MPWLASRVLKVLGDNERWQGTPAELAGRCGMSPVGMSRAIFAPKVSAALGAAGVNTYRGYRGKERVLRLERR